MPLFPARPLAAVLMASALSMALPQIASAQAQAAAPITREVRFAAQPEAETGVLVLALRDVADLAAAGLTDAAAIERALASASFGYGARQTLSLRGIGGWDQILITGLGPQLSEADVQWSGAVAGRSVMAATGPVTVVAPGLAADQAALFASGLGIGHYRSDLYRSSRQAQSFASVTVVAADAAGAQAAYQGRGAAVVEAMTWARDIANEPANVVYPEVFVERARAAFRGVPGVTIEVLDVAQMERLGMGAILGVGQGSERPPRLLVVRYSGQGAPDGGPIALVGKGITFDSGGLSIKPTAGMSNMKMDMSGAAAVTGAVLALARQGAPVNVVAVSALAENMPNGGAMRNGDVLTAMNGTTIEILSTDAEGRLVLADALVWAERNLNPVAVVDIATLTGAVGGALGDDYAGLFSRHDALAAQIEAASAATGEGVWRLPLHPTYAQDVASSIADIKNTGDGGAGAGTGAHFIGEFVSRSIPWAHIDMANMSYGGAQDWRPAGSAGYGVRLLERFVLDFRPVAAD